jgi:hypothetical protein
MYPPLISNRVPSSVKSMSPASHALSGNTRRQSRARSRASGSGNTMRNASRRRNASSIDASRLVVKIVMPENASIRWSR